jgi:outer membrane lipoprotein carrier protein
MKTGYVILVVLISSLLTVSGQQDPEAKKILDEFTRKAQDSYPIRIEFHISSESLMDQSTWNETGELILDNARYFLELEDSRIYCDGSTLWHHVVSAEEVYISDPENTGSEEDLLLGKPQDLFTFYERDFKFRYTAEVEIQGIKYHHIDLFPKDLNKHYHTITLIINQSDYQLYSIQTKGKDGLIQTIQIQDYQNKVKTTEDTFRFDATKHPEVEEIDTRL